MIQNSHAITQTFKQDTYCTAELLPQNAMGIIQLIALTPSFAKAIEKHRYLRTFREGRVSEATVIDYLRKHFFRLLSLNPHSYISRLILSRQEADFEEENVS